MKRLLSIVLSIICLAACQKAPFLSLTGSRSFSFSRDGGTQTITFTCNKDWSASSTESWLRISPSSGSASDGTISVAMTCSPNNTYDSRTATITIRVEELSETITVSQDTGLGLIVSPSSFDLTNAAQTIEVEVQKNVNYSVTIDDACKDWIKQGGTKALTTDKVTFVISANEAYDDRAGKITFSQKDGNLTQTVTVKQSQTNGLFITTPDYELSNEAHTLSVEVKANVQFEVSSQVDWIKFVETKALTPLTIVLDIEANESYDNRTGTVLVKQTNGDLTGTITINQKQTDGLFVAPTEFDLTNQAQTVELEVTNNISFSIVIPDDAKSWISVQSNTNTKALTDDTVVLAISKNDTYDDREASVTIKQVDGPLAETVKICQSAGEGLIVEKTEYEVVSDGGVLDILVEANVDFMVMSEVEWISVAGTKALDNRTIVLYIDANTTFATRVGNVHITQNNGELSQTVVVRQEGNTALQAERDYLIELYNSTGGDNWVRKDNWCSDKPVSEWYGVWTDPCGYVIRLELYDNNLSGAIPNSIADLKNLTAIQMGCNKLTSLPESFSKLTSLEGIYLDDNCFSGPFPDISNMLRLKWLDISNYSAGPEGGTIALDSTRVWYNQFTGKIPEEIGNLKELESFAIGFNRFTGNIPESIWSLPNLRSLELHNNPITGELSPAIANAKKLEILNLENCQLTGEIPTEILELTNLEYLGLGNSDIVAGVDVTYSNNSFHGSLPVDLSRLVNLTQLTIHKNDFTGTLPDCLAEMKNLSDLCAVLNRFNGLISRDIMENPHFKDWYLEPQQDGYGFTYNWNSSEDYSADGKVTFLQRSSEGNGINIVLMGDAFMDEDIASGKYDNVMQKTYEALFNIEPFRSFRDCFNVYEVTVVSPNNGYQKGMERALKTEFGGGTLVWGDNETCINYALKAVDEEDLDETLVIVLMNVEEYAGTCYMYSPAKGDYGNGFSIAFLPLGMDEEMFNGLVHHEANGHGFAKLDDEYAYDYYGGIPEDVIAQKRNEEAFGWWPNIDFVSDPSTIKWSRFISDSRYEKEGLGAYEGGATYWTGVWRPTQESIMNHNTGSFNAPSREAIYKRINKLAFGDSWEYDYEKFVEYDSINRSNAATKVQRNGPRRRYAPLAPPVVCKGPIPIKKKAETIKQDNESVVVYKTVNGVRVRRK